MRLKKYEKIVLGVITLALLVFLFIPVKLPFTLEIQGKFIPAREWYIVRDNDGSITTIQKCNQSNALIKSKTIVASRGDVLQFELAASFLQKRAVIQNELVAVVHSNETCRMLAEMQRRLARANSDLLMYISGEKVELIDEAEHRLKKAEEQHERERIEFERLSALYKEALISTKQFETARSRVKLKQIDVELMTASLKSLKSGAKPAQVDGIKKEIHFLEHEIDILQQKEEQLFLTAPFNGYSFKHESQDTLAFIADSVQLIYCPIAYKHYDRIRPGQTVFMELAKGLVRAELLSKGAKTEYLNTEMFFSVLAKTKHTYPEIPLYSVHTGSLICDGLTPLEYLVYFLELLV